MKRIDLERHLREEGCVLDREGGGHSIWLNPSLRKIASVPRHREIKEGTVRAFANSWKSAVLNRNCTYKGAGEALASGRTKVTS